MAARLNRADEGESSCDGFRRIDGVQITHLVAHPAAQRAVERDAHGFAGQIPESHFCPADGGEK
jgi:hypothetical protein